MNVELTLQYGLLAVILILIAGNLSYRSYLSSFIGMVMLATWGFFYFPPNWSWLTYVIIWTVGVGVGFVLDFFRCSFRFRYMLHEYECDDLYVEKTYPVKQDTVISKIISFSENTELYALGFYNARLLDMTEIKDEYQWDEKEELLSLFLTYGWNFHVRFLLSLFGWPIMICSSILDFFQYRKESPTGENKLHPLYKRYYEWLIK